MTPTTIDANKSLVQRLFDGVNAHDAAATSALVSDDFTLHTGIPDIAPGRAGFRAFMNVFFTAFPEQHVVVHELIAEGDRVVARHTHHVIHGGPFIGLPPSGKEAHVDGIEIFRVADGQIAEMWHQDDLLSLLIQLGAVPPPGQAA